MTFWRRSGAGRRGPEDISEIRLAGIDRPVALKRSRRARRLSLRVNEAKRGAVLTLPAHVSYAEAGDFLARHFEWLRARMAELPEPVPFADGARLPLRGEIHELCVKTRGQGREKVWLAPAPPPPGDLFAHGDRPGGRICVHGPETQVPARLVAWLKKQARSDITRCVDHHAAGLEVRPSRISVRDQATRWGSCSATGALSFSWRLVMAPAFVLDYVAAHEVAHMRELNHGPRFWALVQSRVARLDEARAWLRNHGPRLHRYGAGF